MSQEPAESNGLAPERRYSPVRPAATGQSQPPLTLIDMSTKRKASDNNEFGGAANKARQNVDVLIPSEVRKILLTAAHKYHRRPSRR